VKTPARQNSPGVMMALIPASTTGGIGSISGARRLRHSSRSKVRGRIFKSVSGGIQTHRHGALRSYLPAAFRVGLLRTGTSETPHFRGPQPTRARALFAERQRQRQPTTILPDVQTTSPGTSEKHRATEGSYATYKSIKFQSAPRVKSRGTHSLNNHKLGQARVTPRLSPPCLRAHAFSAALILLYVAYEPS